MKSYEDINNEQAYYHDPDSFTTERYKQFFNQLPNDATSILDVVVAGEFIEHLYPDDVDSTLREFYRLIKPGGSLFLTTPNPNYLLLKLTGKSVLGNSHLSAHFPKELEKKLNKIGFNNIKILGSGKASRFLGEYFPILSLYGSYLAITSKA